MALGAVNRVKNWVVEILTEADLDAEFDNLLENTVQSKTGAYTILNTDNIVKSVDTVAASFSFTLPTAVDIAGKKLLIYREDTSSYLITVATNGSETIAGLSDWKLGGQDAAIKLRSDGANWLIDGFYTPEKVNVIGATGGGTQDVDLDISKVASMVVTTSATTLTISNWPATGIKKTVEIWVYQGGMWSGLVLPTNTRYLGGSAPSLTDTQKTFTDTVSTDRINITSHGYQDGDTIQATTDGMLPAGLGINIPYFVINKTTNDFQISLTQGGAVVSITDTGSGTHTMHSGLDILKFTTLDSGTSLELESKLDIK